ncbi:hypothetical protein POKO110462_03805 [Pontibacter korlensis]|uniref:hypothetical protein n=1 Tax=Pontibacter korlensis TaxID=400092 RepID=UPI00130D4D16|nr:hypothetical protein [Pontibacter korlensis]
MKKYHFLAGTCLLCSLAAAATPDTLHVKPMDLRMHQLKTGLRQYIVTIQKPDAPNVLN